MAKPKNFPKASAGSQHKSKATAAKDEFEAWEPILRTGYDWFARLHGFWAGAKRGIDSCLNIRAPERVSAAYLAEYPALRPPTLDGVTKTYSPEARTMTPKEASAYFAREQNPELIEVAKAMWAKHGPRMMKSSKPDKPPYAFERWGEPDGDLRGPPKGAVVASYRSSPLGR